jgi:hypothetical protein
MGRSWLCDFIGCAERRLLEAENDWLKVENARLQAQLTDTQQDFHQAHAAFEELQTILQENDAIFQELRNQMDAEIQRCEVLIQAQSTAQHEAQHWQQRALAAEALQASQPPTVMPLGPTKAILTRLLAIAHPDRWSRGQPASELAHELTVQLNALRAQWDGRS